MGQILNGIAAELAGWAAIVAGLAIVALLLRLDEARKGKRHDKVADPAPSIHKVAADADWPAIADVAAMELARVPELVSMQAGAARQIDAAEHALNRLLAECATVMSPPVSPTFEPMRQLVREPSAAPVQQQPLAA